MFIQLISCQSQPTNVLARSFSRASKGAVLEGGLFSEEREDQEVLELKN